MSAKKLAHRTRSIADEDGGVAVSPDDSDPPSRPSPREQPQPPGQLSMLSLQTPSSPMKTPGTPTSASHFATGSIHKPTGWALRVENWPSEGTPMDVERVFGFLEHPLSFNIVNDPSGASGDRTLHLSYQTEAGYQKAKDLHGVTLLLQVVPDSFLWPGAPSVKRPKVESATQSPSLASATTHQREPLLYISHPLPSGFLEATRSLNIPIPECPLPSIRVLSIVPDQDAAPPPKSRRKRVGLGSSTSLGALTGVPESNATTSSTQPPPTPTHLSTLTDTFTHLRQLIDAAADFLRRLRMVIAHRSAGLMAAGTAPAHRNALIVELNAQQNLVAQIKAARVRLASMMSTASSALNQPAVPNGVTTSRQPSVSRRTSPAPLSASSTTSPPLVPPPDLINVATSEEVEMDLGSADSSPSIPGLTLLPKAPRIVDVIMRHSPARQFSQVGVGTPESSTHSIDQEVQTDDDLDLRNLEAEKHDLTSRLKKILPEHREAEERIMILTRELSELRTDLEQSVAFRRQAVERCQALEKQVDPTPLEKLKKRYQVLEELYEAERSEATDFKKKHERRKAAWSEEEEVLNKRIRKALDYGDEERALKIRALDDLDEERHRSDKLLKAEEEKVAELEKQVKAERSDREKVENDLRIDLKIMGVKLEDEVRRREGAVATLAEKEAGWRDRTGEYERRMAEMKNSLAESSRQLGDHETQSGKEVEAEKFQLKANLDTLKLELENRSSRLASSIGARHIAEQELTKATKEKEALVIDLENAATRARAVQDQVTQLEQQVSQLTAELTRSRAENSAWEERLKRLEATLKDEESRRSGLQTELSRAEEQRRAEWSQSHEDRAKLEAQAQDLRSTIHRLQLEVQAYEQAAKARPQAQEGTATSASSTLSQSHAPAELPMVLSQWREEVAMNAELRRQIDALTQSLQTRETASNDLERQLADARRELALSNHAIAAQQQGEATARAESARLELRLREVEKEMEFTRERLEQKIEDERVTGSMVLKLTARLIGASYGFRPPPDDSDAMSDIED